MTDRTVLQSRRSDRFILWQGCGETQVPPPSTDIAGYQHPPNLIGAISGCRVRELPVEVAAVVTIPVASVRSPAAGSAVLSEAASSSSCPSCRHRRSHRSLLLEEGFR